MRIKKGKFKKRHRLTMKELATNDNKYVKVFELKLIETLRQAFPNPEVRAEYVKNVIDELECEVINYDGVDNES